MKILFMDFSAEAAKLQENPEGQSPKSRDENTTTTDLPTTADLMDYLTDNTDHDHTQIEEAATALQAEFPFLTEISSYYLLGQRLGLDPAEAFGTKDHDTSLDIANIEPRMVVSLHANIANVNLANPDEKDWKRQDVWLSDDSGTIKLVLWNDDIVSGLTSGDTVKLERCWADTHNGRTQLKLGKDGRVFQDENGDWELIAESSL